MFKKIIIMIAASTTLLACSPLSKTEKNIIGSHGEGIMPLRLTTNPQDSLFLRGVAKPVNKRLARSAEFSVLKERMLATVTDPTNEGVGIAAPQVGLAYRLIAVQRFDKSSEPFDFYIKPIIVSYSEEKRVGREGCLSIPGCAGQVERSAQITIRYNSWEDFSEKEETVTGFTAVIFQHEIDHLDGILFPDRAESMYYRQDEL